MKKKLYFCIIALAVFSISFSITYFSRVNSTINFEELFKGKTIEEVVSEFGEFDNTLPYNGEDFFTGKYIIREEDYITTYCVIRFRYSVASVVYVD